jgi:integrase
MVEGAIAPETPCFAAHDARSSALLRECGPRMGGSWTCREARLHQARHTYASIMIAAGVNAKALSVFMGHSSIKATFDLYGHLMPGTEAEAAALLDAFLDR